MDIISHNGFVAYRCFGTSFNHSIEKVVFHIPKAHILLVQPLFFYIREQ